MRKLITVLTLSCMLQSCESSNLMGKANISDSKVVENPNNSTASVEASGNGISDATEAPASQSKPNSSNLDQGSTNIAPSPAVAPAIIVGASLTCFEKASMSSLHCETRMKGELTDFSPKGIYIILGREAVWTPLSFASVSIGTYDAVLPSATPSSFILAMGLGDAKYIFGRVGNDPLAYDDIVKDGSFENISKASASISASELPSMSASWKLGASSMGACAAGDSHLELVSALGPDAASLGSNYLGLRTNCDSPGTVGNSRISQSVTMKPKHFYQASFDFKRHDANGEGTVKFAFSTGQGFQVSAEVAEWKTSPEFKFLAEVETQNFYLEELKLSTFSRGTSIDNVVILDLGLPL